MVATRDTKLKALPDELTRLYFRLVLPLVAAAALWGTYMAPPHDYRLVAPFAGLLLLASPVYTHLPPKWQWKARLVLALLHVLMVAVMAVVATPLGWVSHGVNMYSINILLIVTPITVLSWNFLFFDQPRLGRVLSLSLALAATVLTAQWLLHDMGEASLALLLLVSSLLASQFGWNVTKLQRQALIEEQDARRDALTGLRNRRAFDEMQGLSLLPGVLVVLDIDHFKAVNDTYGHPAGDRVLRAVGDVLLDMLPTAGSAFRWGGEEFVLILPAHTEQAALNLVEQVRQEVALRSFVGGTHVTLSAGLCRYSPDTPLSEAFKYADDALLHAKGSGRDRIRVSGVPNRYVGQTQVMPSRQP